MPTLCVNGEDRSYGEDAFPPNVLVLIESLGLDPQTVVAEVDGAVVPLAGFAATPLEDGGKVELVRFVGGG